MKKLFCCKTVFALILAILIGFTSASAEPWKFGVISDTQWTPRPRPGEQNPNTIAASIIKQVDQQFINAGVKLVIAVGDMVDTGSQVNDYTRALYAQDLYNAGIGFYPLRGNHEAANGSLYGLRRGFPARLPADHDPAGLNNATPVDITTSLIPREPSWRIILPRRQPALPSPSAPTFLTRPPPIPPTTASPMPSSTTTRRSCCSISSSPPITTPATSFPSSRTGSAARSPAVPPTPMRSPSPTRTSWAATTRTTCSAALPTAAIPGDGYGLDPSTPISTTTRLTVGRKQAAENTFLGLLAGQQGEVHDLRSRSPPLQLGRHQPRPAEQGPPAHHPVRQLQVLHPGITCFGQ